MMSEFETIVATRTYVLACVVLLGLTLLNIILSQIDLRGWNTIVGLLIAATQAVVSAMFLMHMRWSRPVIRLVGAVALLWLAILIVGTLDDAITRGWLPIPGK
jgi:caa(3)-type oxidase subunit IV